MTIEVAILISAVSLAFALYQGITNNKRTQRAENMKDAGDMTTVIVKLESIGASIIELRSEMKSNQLETRGNLERLIKAEESLKAAWRKLDHISKE